MEKPLIVYNLSPTCFGPSWAVIKQFQVVIKIQFCIYQQTTNAYKNINLKI